MLQARARRFSPDSIAIAALAGALGGCVERELRITSDPSGASVVLNHREVGVTPCTVEFTHYGTFDVELRLDGYTTWIGERTADTPAWDMPGPDVLAQVAPIPFRSIIDWHFTLEPLTGQESEGLTDRAKGMRATVRGVAEAPPRSGSATTP